MVRDKNLQPLSRQHHNGLLMVLLLSKGEKKHADLRIMGDFILDGWQKELKEHFIMEEDILVPALQDKDFDRKYTDRLLSEHSQIRSIIKKIEEGLFTTEDLHFFYQTLEQHIRFEERIYFPEAEKILDPEELQRIGLLLHAGSAKNCMDYPVKFWEY
ncbi:MAG: hemerythrin domain-containing protein [Chitinophagaceae bacterium]|nr:hemerythrin domain-containing protein [Chitinophagaceae bacterium]